jgi:hypothetical protein
MEGIMIAKRRGRRDAHTRELDRPIAVAAGGAARPEATELCGQAFVTAGICAECRGPLFAPDRHYHERAARYYVGAEPLCCACKGHAVQGRANAEPIGATS